ncbi:MAG: DGQHR domain-containing protein [Actinobacteria bacterium]|nr:DGQHR domain-containing protein [Actinomycetota bacterium]
MRLAALEIRQGRRRRLYTFAVDGKQLPLFTTVSRVRRQQRQIEGYQRPEVLAHVGAIRSYIESAAPMIPNAIVVAFDTRVRFEPSSSAGDVTYVSPGVLVIPVDEELDDAEKPGWIVDGQQRCAAVREADVRSFPLCVTAFITASEGEQRAQFILVNSTKPLPKGLIYELLPSTEGPLPPALMRKRFPTFLVERLNYDEDSPFRGLIHTPTTPDGVVKDNSILRMLENSLTDGCLYYYRDADTGTGDIEQMLLILKPFWRSVKKVFEDAWDQPPRRSRLMHGVGIASVGYLMDAITDEYIADGTLPEEGDYVAELEPLREVCAWTSGYWHLGYDSLRRWNELQNTPKDIQLLTGHLLREYKRLSTHASDGRSPA